MVNAEPVEHVLTEAVLYRLNSPELADALAGRAALDERTAEVAAALQADQVQLAELTDMYAGKQITAREWMDARNPIQARITRAQQMLARSTRSDALVGLIGNSEQLRGSWSGLNLTRQAAIVRAVLDHAVIGPGTPGARVFRPERVRAVWRF